jgi:hypothetical protein
MSAPSYTDEVIAKKQLCANFRRGHTEYPNLNIDQSFPKRSGIFFRLWCKTQAGVRSLVHDSGYQLCGE